MRTKTVSKYWHTNRYFFVIMCILLVVLYYLYENASHRSPTKIKKCIMKQTPASDKVDILKDIKCYQTPGCDLQTEINNYAYPENTIFFVETSCKGSLNSRQACSVESAARAHPNRQTTVLFPAPLSDGFKNGSTFFKLSTELNVEFVRINISDFAKLTPLEDLFAKDILKNSQHPVVHASDILRILTLYKYGGLYLDLDVIVMKSFDSLPRNFVARESKTAVASGILAFSTEGIGKIFSESAVRDLAATFDPRYWSYNGPGLIARTLQKICSVNDVQNMTDTTCQGFHVLDSKLFFPIYYPSWREYFKDVNPPINNDAYTHHIWNALASQEPVPKNSLFARLAEKYCPRVYNLYGDSFGF